MKQLTRTELRKNIMTILYQINVYTLNKIEYDVDDTKIGDERFSNPKETIIELTDIDDWFGGIRVIL